VSADTVLQELAGKRGNLLATILTNEDVAALVMGLLGRMIYFAETEKRMPVEGITVDPLVVEGNVFKARVRFSPVAIARSYIWSPKKEFVDYVRMKAGNMAQAMSDNPNLGKFFQDLTEHLVRYCEHKGFPFAHLQFTKHVITPDWVVVLEVARKPYV
jgi:hypothetical protein